MIAAITFMHVPKQEVLFRCGDRGQNFYVCLSGKCQLYIPNPERSVLKNTIKELEATKDAKN